NNLYAHTQMQIFFGINMVALEEGQPKTMNLKQMLEIFIRHRRVVVNRRTVFELRKARERAHILEGLSVALANLDKVIEMIKTAANPQDAKEKLQNTIWQPNSYKLSDIQAQAILDLRLHRLTGLEQEKILEEYNNIQIEIGKLLDILNNPSVLM